MTSDPSKIESVLDELLQGCDSPQDMLGEHAFVKAFTTRVIERALQAE